MEGASGDRMFFLTHGQIRYVQGGSETGQVKIGEWLSEPSLWTVWNHVGTAEPTQTSELLSFNVSDLQDVLCCFIESAEIVMNYCQTFFEFAQEPGTFVNDLLVSMDYQELMTRLPTETRQAIAKPIWERLEKSIWGSVQKKKLDLLRHEVLLGKCKF